MPIVLALLLLVVGSLHPECALAQGAPASPSLAIRRAMVDPAGVSDARGEWIEIENRGSRPIDLRGWRLRSANDREHRIIRSLIVPASGSVVLTRLADARYNGRVRSDLVFTGISLGNARDWLVLADPAGRAADSLAWTRAVRGSPMGHPAPAGDRVATGSGSPDQAGAGAAAAVDTASALVVSVLDVGQGDAILIRNGGSTVLVDGGPDPAVLGRYLDAFGLNGGTIDAVILTHGHSDHYQGLRELFASWRGITVRNFWENGDPSPNSSLARLRDSIGARMAAGTLVSRDTDDPCATGRPLCTITLRGGARLHVLAPDPQGPDANNRSVALKLVGPDSASFTMWMAGDAEFEAIDHFDRVAGYSTAPGMRADVLKANHHGSCNGVTARYLEATRPSVVVASLAGVNDYGHMHDQAVALYRAVGAALYRTDLQGTVTFRTPGIPGGGFAVGVDRDTAPLVGPSDRRSTQPGCAPR